ncbi:hypothetical protein GCM10009415_25020 [Chitinophaga japonensis]
MQVLHRLINGRENWTGKVVASTEEAITACSEAPYHILLLCAGIPEADAAVIKERLAALQPHIIIIRHFGGGSGLLESEIRAALDAHQIQLR